MRFKWTVFLIAGAIMSAQSKERPGDWPRYSRDLASTRFSPLNQITTGNVGKAQDRLDLSSPLGRAN